MILNWGCCLTPRVLWDPFKGTDPLPGWAAPHCLNFQETTWGTRLESSCNRRSYLTADQPDRRGCHELLLTAPKELLSNTATTNRMSLLPLHCPEGEGHPLSFMHQGKLSGQFLFGQGKLGAPSLCLHLQKVPLNLEKLWRGALSLKCLNHCVKPWMDLLSMSNSH